MRTLSLIIALLCSVLVSFIFLKAGNDALSKSETFIRVAQAVLEEKNFIKRHLKLKTVWLRQMGVSYMLGRDISVYFFYSIKFVSSILLAIVVISLFRGAGFMSVCVVLTVTLGIGYIIPDLILIMSNESDNSIMLNDIRLIYDTLKIQSKSGVYITDILSECQLLVQMPRLKKALMELTNEIYTKHNLSSGLKIFNSKFKNIYIDMLVMTIEQSVQSGQSVQMFQDIAQQIHDVEQALYEKEKRRAENKMLIYQLAVYFAILLIVVYAMFSQLISAFSFR